MSPVDEGILDELEPLSSKVLDELSNTLTAAASTAQEAKTNWRPRTLLEDLESVKSVVSDVETAFSRAESNAREARRAANCCGYCGTPLEYGANGSRWCPNLECMLGQHGKRKRLHIEFLIEPPTEEIREMCRAYWQQDEYGHFVYDRMHKIGDRFGCSGAKVVGTVRSHCRVYTELKCEDCGEPLNYYVSRANLTREGSPTTRKCSKCLRA